MVTPWSYIRISLRKPCRNEGFIRCDFAANSKTGLVRRRARGAGGVILSAVGAHLAASPLLTTAATFLMIHAVAVVALAGLALA
jgi:hypothetical protein